MTRLPSEPVETLHPDTVDGWGPGRYSAFTDVFAGYRDLRAAVVEATRDLRVERFLDLGCGTGETTGRLLRLHGTASTVLVDANRAMLRAACAALPARRVAALRQRLEDPLPSGPFDLVVSVLAVHHLDPAEKAALFARIREVLAPGGRFVLGDVVLGGVAATGASGPETGSGRRLRRIVDQHGLGGSSRLVLGRMTRRMVPRMSGAGPGGTDRPDLLRDQIEWLEAARLRPEVRWQQGSMVVVAADRLGGRDSN